MLQNSDEEKQNKTIKKHCACSSVVFPTERYFIFIIFFNATVSSPVDGCHVFMFHFLRCKLIFTLKLPFAQQPSLEICAYLFCPPDRR